MSDTSHAGHATDVALGLAFLPIESGRYLDWSDDPAHEPSITRALYDRGWSGISVRPSPTAAAALAAARPRETVLCAGQADRLGNLATRFADSPLHLLRIAQPGMDTHALCDRGLLSARPWVVVLNDPAAEAEAMLHRAGYRASRSQGGSRVYVSAEHPEFVQCTALQPGEAAGVMRTAAPDAALAVAEARVNSAQFRLADAVITTGYARRDIRLLHERAAWLEGVVARAQQGETDARAETAWLRERLDAAQAATLGHLGQLAARADEVAWLRGCLADSQAEAAAASDRSAALQSRIDALEGTVAAFAAAKPARRNALRQLGRRVRRLGVLLRHGARQAGPAPPTDPAIAIPAPAIQDPAPAPSAAAEAAIQRPDVEPRPPVKLPEADPEPIAPGDEPPLHIALPAPQPAAPVMVVHQFHAGSARGDAITNSMVLIRALLRDAGYRSDIYVETVGAGLEGQVLPVDTLPDHDGYVLIIHHSMGFPSFERLRAIPARKILLYHNITPPEFLVHTPHHEQAARLGREQLAAYRGDVAFALADSDYNAIELVRLGFPIVRTCTLLFDTTAMAQLAATPKPQTGVFTVLFVGRVTPSKGQADLAKAFAAFAGRFGGPCQLVLVGALDPDDYAFIERIRALAASAGLADWVHLTGTLPDAELHRWYRQADLYVSLSQHEGFAVPLVEAMAYGIPIVALPTGAVPFTLGGAGVLLRSTDPADIADAMLAAARGPGGHEADLDRFAVQRQWPVLQEALAAAGAPSPIPPATYAAASANLQITIAGHMAGSYSLASVNRGLARTLEAHRPGTVRLLPVEGEPTADLSGVPTADRAFVATLAVRPHARTGPELVLSGHYPVYVPAQQGDLLAALFFWEESLIPAATVAVLNADFDAVLAPSRFVAKALVDSGVGVPVVTIGQAPDLAPFAALPARPQRTGPFVFLHVSSAFPRKGLDALLAAWAQAFTSTDPVRLVIKAFPNPHNDAAAQIDRLRAEHPRAAPIELIDGELAAGQILTLYQTSHAVVLPSRGEGYNLPAAEAMAAGVPVIVTAHGGHLDFCSTQTARLVERRFAASRSHLATPHSLWAEPDVDDLAAALREAAAGALDTAIPAARRAIAAAADGAAMTARLADVAARLLLAPPAPPVRIGWVSTWDVRCGIAEYSRALLASLKRDGLAEPLVLADDRTPDQPGVRAAWQVGDPASVERIMTAIARADADIAVIQHQPGLLPWPTLGRLVEAIAVAGRLAVVTLHNTRHLLDLPPSEQDAAIAGLGHAARILVHTLDDLMRLDAFGLADRTTLLPHAAAPGVSSSIRTLPPGAAPLIGCTGFFLPGKGVGALIAAMTVIREQWPAAKLRLVNAEYDHPASAAEIAACRALAAEAGLDVEWRTAFLPLAQQQALLRDCDLLVLPYEASKESSSAALRSALATGVAVAVTPLPLFDEAGDAVFRLAGCDAAAIGAGVAALLADAGRRADLAAAARVWLAGRDGAAIGLRLHGMLTGLAAQRRVGAPVDGGVWRPASA